MTVPLNSLTDTWNAGATVFTAIQMNVTNTASAAASKLLDLQVAGASQFNVDPSGDISIQTDTNLFRDAAGIFAQRNSTAAQTLRVYNTFTDASNYERGVFDWTTTANTFIIGTQKAGTGAFRNMVISNCGDSYLQGWFSGSGDWFIGNAATSSNVISILLGSSAGNPRIAVPLNGRFVWAGASSNDATQAPDTGLSRIAAGVVGLGNSILADVSGFIQWGGQKRVTSDFSVTSSAVLVNVTGLSVDVAAGRTYTFQVYLTCTCAAAGGVKAAIAGTCTATAIEYDGYILDTNTTKGQANSTALAGTVASATTTGTAGIVIEITGTITVNAAGTLTVQFAQNTSNATASIVKRGSYMIVHDIP